MTGAHQWEGKRRRAIRGQEPLLGENGKSRANFQRREVTFEMDVAFAYVDFSAKTQYLPAQHLWAKYNTNWNCGLTARKEGNYQRKSKREHRRYVPADRVYYIQSAYSFQ